MASKAKPRRKRRTYTEDEKTQALALYTELGPKKASDKTKIPRKTISTWAKRAGLKTKVVATTAAATETAKVKAELVREQLRIELLDAALDILRRISKQHIDKKVLKDGTVVTLEFDAPTPSGVREYLVAFGIAIDKYRLERGETTDLKGIEYSGSVAFQGVPDDELRAGLSRVLAKLEQQG